ncbi:Triosephosphate isomerase [Hondaea fermentalgiana]|uniref:Triosephosphate isomerase n=1 Tax=Hondaea fermentalgiana TaxID=2315210 RepID=A0A2R5H073_9STRA|nr:Triosephosphate isomerase [Hondaea fermentalgiana]|eukprot:GBG34141.1 Triosephosphate isomerase [Hondaea fermentalgiana]
MTGKKVVIGGNWKCNGTKESVKELIETLNSAGDFPSNAEVVVAPTALHLGMAVDGLRKDISVSVQNLWKEPKAGAWTGELTVDLIKDFGINWAILGHSERRAYCGETPEIVGTKVKIALEAGMKVMACIGEQLSDREADKTMDVCKEQLDPIIAAVPSGAMDRVVIAYEPVWAIGTGVTATPEQAQETHEQIRAYLKTKIGEEAAQGVRIIYGGSVKGANCQELIKKADIDGFLVGGASLKPEFKDIIACSSAKSKM